MTVVLARVDQRLIHGLTVNQWKNELNPTRYMVVDNQICLDDTLKAGMRLSKPLGTGMSIISEEKAILNFKSGNYDEQRVFILVKEPQILEKLIESGVSIDRVNVGIVFNEDNRIAVTNRVALNKEEVEALKHINSLGVEVELRYAPGDTAILLEEALKNIKF